MNLFMTLVVAVKALRRNAMRTALTALGMIIGVAAVIVMVAIGTGARSSIEAQIRNAGSNIVNVNAGSGGFGGVRQGQGAVTTLTPQNLLNQCFNGVNAACSNFIRDANGNLSTVLLRPINYAAFQTRGVDIDLNYTLPLAGGDTLNLRSVTNRLISQKLTNPGATPQEQAGDVGLFANPKWRNTTQLTYGSERFTGFLQARYIGGGIVDSVRAAAGTLLDQKVKGRLYFDGQIAVRPEGTPVELYLNVRNLLNKTPPVYPSGSTSNPAQTNGSLFDMVGRMFSFGVNVKM